MKGMEGIFCTSLNRGNKCEGVGGSNYLLARWCCLGEFGHGRNEAASEV